MINIVKLTFNSVSLLEVETNDNQVNIHLWSCVRQLESSVLDWPIRDKGEPKEVIAETEEVRSSEQLTNMFFKTLRWWCQGPGKSPHNNDPSKLHLLSLRPLDKILQNIYILG